MTNPTETGQLAWHWLSDSGVLRDGRPAPSDGVWLEHVGECRMCEIGLHASFNIIDSLKYAPGLLLCRVTLEGIEDSSRDKVLATRRRIEWRYPAKQIVLAWACRTALDVIHLWDAPDKVKLFLEAGKDITYAARTTEAAEAAWASADAAWASEVAWAAWAAWSSAEAAWASEAAGSAAGAARAAWRAGDARATGDAEAIGTDARISAKTTYSRWLVSMIKEAREAENG